MKSKLAEIISVLLAVVIFCGVLPFSIPAEAYRGTSIIKSYDVLEEQYDKFIYLGEEAYEEDMDGNLVLTDYYVQPGDWITYRLYIKSDLFIGNSTPYTAYDNSFFDVRICTDYPNLSNGYETLNDSAPKNPDHPMVRDQQLCHSLTSKAAINIAPIRNGFCELDVDTETLDIVMNQWTKDTAVYPHMNVFTSDEWLLEWKVQVREDLYDGTRGISQIYYNMFKYAGNPESPAQAARKPADIASADCATDVPQWADVPKYNQAKNMYINRDIIQHFFVEDTYMEFYIGENPEHSGSYNPDECSHRYSSETIGPDCENAGRTIYTCERCGDSFSSVIPATGHSAGDWETEPDTNNPSEGRRVKKCMNCGSVLESESFGIVILAPEPSAVNIGDYIWLHAEVKGNLPEGSQIVWTADNENFEIAELSEDGRSCKITAVTEGTAVFSVSVSDSEGKVILTAEQEVTSQTNLIQKIIALFKNFFDDIIEFFKSIGALFAF